MSRFKKVKDGLLVKLASFTASVANQHAIIREAMLAYIDGIECWHSRHSRNTIKAYRAFALKEGLAVTGGSDCHQQPVIMGTIKVPDYVAGQFDLQKTPRIEKLR